MFKFFPALEIFFFKLSGPPWKLIADLCSSVFYVFEYLFEMIEILLKFYFIFIDDKFNSNKLSVINKKDGCIFLTSSKIIFFPLKMVQGIGCENKLD